MNTSQSMHPYAHHVRASSLDVFSSQTARQPSLSLNVDRRQRITMACAHCRQRKIRCCGGSPCRNCTRAARPCEYAAVPEDVNRATREKKAQAKAQRHSEEYYQMSASPLSTFGFESPLSVPSATMPQPATLAPPLPIAPPGARGHRRTASTPENTMPPYVAPPPAPQLSSPAMFESSSWMYSDWSSAPVPLSSAPSTPIRVFPSVLTSTPVHAAFMADRAATLHSRVEATVAPVQLTYGSSELPSPPDSESRGAAPWSSFRALPQAAYVGPAHAGMLSSPHSTPVHEQARFNFLPISPPVTPVSKRYYSPYPSPAIHTSQQPIFFLSPSPEAVMDTSPTLAPEASLSKGLVGLGIGMPMTPVDVEPSYSSYASVDTDYYPTLPCAMV